MINLLPHEIKQDYRYARRNRRMIRWLTGFGLGIAGMVAITGAGILYMNHSVDTYNTQIAADKAQLKAQDLSGLQKQVTDMSNNLKLMVQVLSKEVLFSKLLSQLGSVTPPNVILTGLTISQTEGGLDITAQTTNYNAATQLQVNLADPKNQIFSQADIVSITCNSSASNPKYPCTVTLRALFASNNPFLFINGKAGS